MVSRLGFSDLGALFPCPSEIKLVERLISRDAIVIAMEQMLLGLVQVLWARGRTKSRAKP